MVAYQPLKPPINQTDPVAPTRPWWWPKLTRLKAVPLLVLVACAGLLLAYKALSPSRFRSKPPKTAMFGTPPPRLLAPHPDPTSTTTEVPFVDRIRYKHTKRRLPWCIIIGVRKAGTRALLTFLDLHPQVRTARNEVHFFDSESNYEQGLEWYRKRMPYSFAGQITIEKSPAYFSNKYVPKRVYHMNSTIKLLVVVRDPVPRAVSDYLQIHVKRLSMGKQHGKFEHLALDSSGDIDSSYRPVQRSLYYDPMQRWLSWFDRKQLHVVDGDRLVVDPVSELAKVESFLGLEHKITIDHFYYNKTRGFYCLRNETGGRCLAESKGRQHPDIDVNILTKLRAFYRPYNRRFYRMVDQWFNWD